MPDEIVTIYNNVCKATYLNPETAKAFIEKDGRKRRETEKEVETTLGCPSVIWILKDTLKLLWFCK
jgi:hypothetical protein